MTIQSLLSEGKFKEACYLALSQVVENNGEVYLPNAYELVQLNISRREWSGYLSALSKEGKYEPLDDLFGTVIL